MILSLAWVTPAFIGGMLGWKGMWGAGNAFVEYLIPIPLAGGVFHVPSFIIAALVIVKLKDWPTQFANIVPLIALSILLVAQTMQLDFKDLNA
jgi:hypothetical protein